jgi:hypothetical protein
MSDDDEADQREEDTTKAPTSRRRSVFDSASCMKTIEDGLTKCEVRKTEDIFKKEVERFSNRCFKTNLGIVGFAKLLAFLSTPLFVTLNMNVSVQQILRKQQPEALMVVAWVELILHGTTLLLWLLYTLSLIRTRQSMHFLGSMRYLKAAASFSAFTTAGYIRPTTYAGFTSRCYTVFVTQVKKEYPQVFYTCAPVYILVGMFLLVGPFFALTALYFKVKEIGILFSNAPESEWSASDWFLMIGYMNQIVSIDQANYARKLEIKEFLFAGDNLKLAMAAPFGTEAIAKTAFESGLLHAFVEVNGWFKGAALFFGLTPKDMRGLLLTSEYEKGSTSTELWKSQGAPKMVL